MVDSREVLVELDGPVARVTLNRPHKMNAITDVMLDQLVQALADGDHNPAVKVIVLSGNGENFSSGYDMAGGSEYTRISPDIQSNLAVVRHMRTTYQALWNTRKPVIGKVHGYCIAGGCYLQMLCDVSIAADDARLGHPGVSIGGVSAMPLWNWFLGLRKAKELLLTGKLINGREAAQIGLVNESVPRDDLDSAVDRWASEMAALPLDSLLLCKESLNTAADVMGLSATFRTHGALSALARMGSEVDPDLEAQRSRAASRIATLNTP